VQVGQAWEALAMGIDFYEYQERLQNEARGEFGPVSRGARIVVPSPYLAAIHWIPSPYWQPCIGLSFQSWQRLGVPSRTWLDVTPNRAMACLDPLSWGLDLKKAKSHNRMHAPLV
jgi:hypothetical protein